MGALERKTPRNFNVQVKDYDGNSTNFRGRNCTVNNETLWQRVGIGDVRETITCESFEVTDVVIDAIEHRPIDLERYSGKWYEIASVPAWFQRNCEDTMAKYTQGDGYIEVKNTCTRPRFYGIFGKKTRSEIVGKAFTTGESNLLKVQFAPPFKSDYRIEYVDNDYEHAIVSSGKYLWLLAREQEITDKKYDDLVAIAREHELDTGSLRRTARGSAHND